MDLHDRAKSEKNQEKVRKWKEEDAAKKANKNSKRKSIFRPGFLFVKDDGSLKHIPIRKNMEGK